MKTLIFCLSVLLAGFTISFASDLDADFRSHGSERWKNIDLSVSYSKDWAMVSGDRANTPIKFVSDSGNGIAVFTITIRDIPEGATAADIVSLLEDDEFRQSLIVRGEKVAESRVIDIDGNKSLYTLSMITREKALETKRTLNWKYLCPFENHMILFAGSLNTPPEVEQELILKAANHYGDIFARMVDSVIIHNRWKP